MVKLRALWKKDPGLVVSAGFHLAAFVVLITSFSAAPDMTDQVESVPVEMITTSQFNQISNGEKTAKQMPKPQRRVDKIAELEDHKPAPPLAEARKDTPPPPSPEKANDDPGDDDKPEDATAATPPVPTPPERPVTPVVQVPTPPERPVEKTETAKEDPDDKPDAEAVTKKPPPPPKKVAKVTPPKRPDPPRKPEPKPKQTLDEVAKLLDNLKPPKPAKKARAGNEAKEAKHSAFSLDKITALLDHEAPQRKASTGRQLTQLASLGSPTGHADKLSPTMMAQIDGWLIDHYRGCWNYFGLGAAADYVPRVRVRMAPDGSLMGEPSLINPPSDPNLRSLADSALRAVNRCNPMDIPEWFKPHYDAWRDRTVRFDPKELS